MRTRANVNLNIKEVLYKTYNVLLVSIRRTENTDTVFVICEGCSMSVGDKNELYKYDPFLTIPDENEYQELEGDIIEMYFPFECQGLEEAGIDFSHYINYNMKKYKNIILIGHSKGGVCFANMARMLDRMTKMLFVSTPFKGTIMTDPEKMEKILCKPEYKLYRIYYYQHIVDLDIMPGSYFMRTADFSGVKNHTCINVISQNVHIRTPMDLGCKYLNSKLGYEHGDGIVDLESQEYIHEIAPVKKVYIDATHANSLKRLISKNRNRYIIK